MIKSLVILSSILTLVFSLPHSIQKDVSQYNVTSCANYFHSPYSSFSCLNRTQIPEEDSCCFEYSGVLMQTQFWDYNSSYLDLVNNLSSDQIKELESKLDTGTETSKLFTIHGLWNDLCDGTYHQFCDPLLEISDSTDNITHVIVDEFGEVELYNKMIKYWINNDKSNVNGEGTVSLWEHEYNKHGTCMNTLLPKCFNTPYRKFENIVSYYKKVVEIWETLPTYKFLADKGIVPSLTKRYKLSDIQSALAKRHRNKEVYVGCQNGAIDEIWYYYHLKGNVLAGEYRPIDSLTDSTCPELVWYLPK